ncbi:MAG: beta-propeller fold lactonase family protein [Verrucomicrobiota bacterium]
MILRFLIYSSLVPVFAFGGDLLFVGSSNDEGLGGVYVSEFADGTLTEPKQVAKLPRKVTIELSRDQKTLYGCMTTAKGGEDGELIAWRILEDGTLEEINRQSSGVDHFCSLAQTPNGLHLVGTSFGLGIVTSFIFTSDQGIGKLASELELPRFPKGNRTLARAHDVEFSNDGRFAFVTDISNNRVYTFSLNKVGELKEVGFVTSETFVGPRHLILNQEGNVVYVLCQRGSNVTAFHHDGEGQLSEFQTIPTLPSDYDGATNHSAEILIHPNGQFLYASNRGADSLAVFHVKPDGTLTNQQIISSGGGSPWSFEFDSAGKHLICSNRNSSNLVVFKINPTSGELLPISEVAVPDPLSMALRKG